MGSRENDSFSIRNYVLESREKDIRNNWPFPEKYLEVCMKHGINRLLPPFKSLDHGKCSSHEEHTHSSYIQEDNAHVGINNSSLVEINREKEHVKAKTHLSIDEAVSELTKQMSPLSLSTDKHKQDNAGLISNIAITGVHTSTFVSDLKCHPEHCDYEMPSTKILSRKRKKHKRKLKKRSLAEIYAEASPHTLEEFVDIGGSTSAAAPTVMRYVCAQGTTESKRVVHEINGNLETADQNYSHNPVECLKMKYPRDGNEEESTPRGGDSDAYDSKAIS